MIPAPNQSQIQTALVKFLTGVLPSGVVVIAGQANRVAEPAADDFVVFWPLSRPRLATNIDTYTDAVFTGSIAGTTMTITAVNHRFSGKLAAGIEIFGVGLAEGSVVVNQLTGTPGGIGTYTISPSQNISSETIAGGTAGLLQKTEILFQCDVHGPNSSDNAQVISTAMRDPIASRYFNPAVTGVAPLYADNPRQVPFLNGESQWETRYIVEAHLQANQLVIFPQEFAEVAEVDVISVDATYPP